MQAADLHLTLAFLGDLDSGKLAQVCEIAASLVLPAEDLRVGCLAYWSHNRILWAGLQHWPEAMAAFVDGLHGALRSAGLRLDARRFVPHLTLARHASLPVEGLPALPDDLSAWPIAGWCLAASAKASDTGLRYRKLDFWSIR